MGRSLTSNHIFNAEKLTKAQFKKKFTDMMKAKGYTSAKADDGEISYALAFSGDRSWVTVLTEESTDTRKEAAGLAKNLGLQVLSAELVDSDFAELTLYEKSGAAVDTMFLGEPYFDEYPEPSPLKWQTLLNIDWAKVEEIQSKDYTFADDALCEFGEVIGCENMLLEFDGADDDVVRLYFKKAGEKKLTLNAAFKKYFGEVFEPLGFKAVDVNKRTFFVKVINNDILEIVTYRQLSVHKVGFKTFEILCGVCSLNYGYIDFTRSPESWLTNIFFVNIDSQHEINEKVMMDVIQYHCDIWNVPVDKEIRLRGSIRAAFDNRLINFLFSSERVDGMKILSNATKEIVMSEYDCIHDNKDLAEYYYSKHYNMRICDDIEKFKERPTFIDPYTILLIISGYRKDTNLYIEEMLEIKLKSIKQSRVAINDIEEYKANFRKELKKQDEIRDMILDDPDIKNKVIEYAGRCREKNIEVLRSYGIEI